MPITPTNTVSAATMAANWGPGVTNNAAKWLNKYLNPKRAFNANPQAAQTTWQNAIQAAIARNAYANGMQNADLNQAATNATNFGRNNYAAAGTNKAANYAKRTVALAAAINAALANLPPRGSDAANEQRALDFMRAMRQAKGTIK